MKKLLATVFAIIAVCMSCLMIGCKPTATQGPLTVEDCFKDFVQVSFFRRAPFADRHEIVPFTGQTENVSLSKLLVQDNNISAAKYSDFKIFTTANASKVRVTSIRFDVITTADCNVLFSLQLAKGVVLYSTTVSAQGGEPATVEFAEMNKGWSRAEAGKSELVNGLMKGTEETYMLISLLNKDELLDNDYIVNNLQIEIEETK